MDNEKEKGYIVIAYDIVNCPTKFFKKLDQAEKYLNSFNKQSNINMAWIFFGYQLNIENQNRNGNVFIKIEEGV